MPEACKEQIVSDLYEDGIIGYYGQDSLLAEEGCYQRVNEDFAIVHRAGTEQSDVAGTVIRPLVFGLLQEENLEETGIGRVRRIPGFDYRGNDILIGFVDTGVDYSHPAFLREDGVSRVKTIWDQSNQSGTPPEGFLYGTEFGEAEIAAGTAPKDENGHGTFLAGVAAGKTEVTEDFFGVAPLAELAIVKLKEVKPYLRQFYYIQEGVSAFGETDIMMGVKYLLSYARKQQKPMVLCLGVGTSLGSHRGTIPLSQYLNSLAYQPDVCIIAAVGNEGNTRHHARVLSEGRRSGADFYRREEENRNEVELYVGERGKGFTVDIFSEAIAGLELKLTSPAGETVEGIANTWNRSLQIPFLLDRTRVTVERENLTRTNLLQHIQLRFQTPSVGVWKFEFSSKLPTEADLWLPLAAFVEGEIYFLVPEPEITLCEPANAPLLFSVGAYVTANGGAAPFTGRGFTGSGQKQPTVLAPGVDVVGPFAGGGYITKSGTSAAAAFAAGVVALFMEYIEEYRRSGESAPLDTVLLRNLFSLGAQREENSEYPNVVSGYGKINLYGVFEFLRNL